MTKKPPAKCIRLAGGTITTSLEDKTMKMNNHKVWQCILCDFLYDEYLGLPEHGIAPGTRWQDVPDDWECPDCGVGKADFEMQELQTAITA